MKALSDLRSGVDLNREKSTKRAKALTLDQAYAELRATRNYRAKTLEIYDAAILRSLKDWLDKPILSITKDMVQNRHRALSNVNSSKGKGEALANQVMRVLRVVLNHAAITYEDEEGKSILPENPVRRLSQVKGWNEERRRQDVIRDHELEAWYKAVTRLRNPVLKDYFLILVFSGLRRSEAAHLRWSYIDFQAKTITIPGELTKNHETHELPMSDILLLLLKHRENNLVNGNPYVFPGSKQGCCIAEPKRAVKFVVGDSGVKFFSHTLRRTFISVGERLDIPYLALKNLLNHKTRNDVTAGYIVTETERLRLPMQKIADHLKTKMGIADVPQTKEASL
jgi:integrase